MLQILIFLLSTENVTYSKDSQNKKSKMLQIVKILQNEEIDTYLNHI